VPCIGAMQAAWNGFVQHLESGLYKIYHVEVKKIFYLFQIIERFSLSRYIAFIMYLDIAYIDMTFPS
jgi:hypothetical protein